jgi:hypothetical protein
MVWDYTNDYSSTILAYTSGAGTITVVSVTGLPASGKYFILKVDNEYFLCTSYTSLVLTVAGGQAGSTPANHSLGAAITGCWIVPQVLDGIKSDIKAAAALVLLEQHIASSSATLDFTACITSIYDEYEIHLIDVLPATNNVTGELQFSTDGGSTYDSSSIYSSERDYRGLTLSDGGYTQFGNVSGIWLGGTDVGNTTVWGGLSGKIWLYNPASTDTYKRVLYELSYGNNAPNSYRMTGAGIYKSTDAVNALRILFSTGNIVSGIVRVYGVAKA